MKEIVDRILDGQFEYDNGSLDFSQVKIEIQIKPGETYEGSFRIIGKEDKLTEGFEIGRASCRERV